MRKTIVSVMVSVALAFSMVSTTALSAYADQMGVASLEFQLATNDKVVYDSVYGVFGGEYALMYKDVQYQVPESEETHTKTVIDVVKSDGTVTVHTAPDMGEGVEVPGGQAEYEVPYWVSEKTFAKLACIGLKSKKTGKYGVKRFDGADLVPIEYDEIRVPRWGDVFVAPTYGDDDAQVSFFRHDGARAGGGARSDM